MGNIAKIHLITGHIGCGKSSIGDRLMSNGFMVIDTDFLRKDVYRHDPSIRTAVISKYGQEALDNNGLSDYIRLASLDNNFMYMWLEDLTGSTLTKELIRILVNEDECRYASKPHVFIEASNTFSWIKDALSVFPKEKIGKVFKITADLETRIFRVAQRLRDRGFTGNSTDIDHVRSIVTKTDELQTNIDSTVYYYTTSEYYPMEEESFSNPDGTDMSWLTDQIMGSAYRTN